MMQGSTFTRFALQLGKGLEGLPLATTEAAIAEAQAANWHRFLGPSSSDAVKAERFASDAGKALFDALSPFSLLEGEAVIQELRFLVYLGAYEGRWLPQIEALGKYGTGTKIVN